MLVSGDRVCLTGVKRAVELARGYLSDALQIPQAELLLEEVELSEDQQFWLPK